MLLKKLIKKLKIQVKTWGFYSQVLVILLMIGMIFPIGIEADEINELRSKISEKSVEMQKLEEEIASWEKELNTVGAQKQSLSRDVKELDTTQKKLNSIITLTNNQISTTALKIEKLGVEIEQRENEIGFNSSALAEAVRAINEQESYTLLESFLANESLSDIWNDMEGLQKIQTEIKIKTKALKELRQALTANKEQSEDEKEYLSVYKVKLADQKVIVENNKEEKDKLLTETKNKESNYQAILDEKKALRDKFEAELMAFEDELRLAVDPNSIPESGRAVLSWPVDKVYITQFFGNTPFATKNPQVYGSGGHNGIDFRASVGTNIKTVLSGTVTAIGNTDLACPGASYGKWVLVRHNNGLSSLYGHLSLIKVSEGQVVVTGDVIGYSGNTGYSTGPHLHLTVYATQGLRVQNYDFKSCKGTSTVLPLATREAYLNPLSYLPEY